MEFIFVLSEDEITTMHAAVQNAIKHIDTVAREEHNGWMPKATEAEREKLQALDSRLSNPREAASAITRIRVPAEPRREVNAYANGV